MTESDKDFASTIVSSDKDLLQLISDETEVKLLKQTGFIRYNHETFKQDYGIEPIRIIDLKALMGDASDNIPGVKGIGEKTALKLLQEYDTIENLYDNVDKVGGKIQEKLVNDKENAFMSKKIATIYRDVPLNINLEDLHVGKIKPKIAKLFQELEFFSLLKNMMIPVKDEEAEIEIKEIANIDDVSLDDTISLYLELDDDNYHLANILGLAIKDSKESYFIRNNIVETLEKIKNKNIITFDAKKIICNTGVKINCTFDVMIASYLCNYINKEDIAFLMQQFNLKIDFFDSFMKYSDRDEKIAQYLGQKVDFLYNIKDTLESKLKENNYYDLFTNIEMPLLYVLADMEQTGIKVEKDVLEEMKVELNGRIEEIKKEIYNYAGEEFNISSPRQLGEVLFDKMQLAVGKKNKTGYKTDAKVLEKLVGKHPIIESILLYRNLTKIYSTYIEGLENFILKDGKVHTIYKQTLTRTGRLSSVDPNLQNIPVWEELGRKIRKAFVPENEVFLSADYSQIELRILAHISNCKPLIEAFKNGEDIHTKVASDIYGIPASGVTKNMRRTAKAVIFGIVYGISGFGLGENLNISRKEADEFIKKYYAFYPEVKEYMDSIILKTHDLGYVTTLFGRRRVIDEINNTNYMIRSMGERMALNTPIQGTSADIMKLAMINVYNRFKKENVKSKILLQVHDEIIIDCKNEELDKIKQIVKEEMENVFPLNVPLKVEIDTGSNWYDTK